MKTAIIDLGFGDSGKGLVTSWLCKYYPSPIVVRFSGGHQAGHTVVHNGIRHVFSSFGSGTLQGVPTYWDKNCTFHPTGFLNELYELKEKGVNPKIYINSKCPVTTFADIKYNKMINDANGHGSVGVGFGATLEREEKYYSLTVGDLMFPSVAIQKIMLILEYYHSSISWDGEELRKFIIDCSEVLSTINIVEDSDIKELFEKYTTILYEGSQGLLLDKDIGFFPHVTRSNVGSKNIDPNIVYYVTRAYQTRHGNGPMTNYTLSHNITENPDETNVSNYQGEFRRTLLDLDLLKYAMYKDDASVYKNCKNLVITCMDHVQNDLRFTYKGKIINCINENEFVNKIKDILGIGRVYTSHSDDGESVTMYKEIKDENL
jgi:adenylosuccinate synthase